ncbi:MAG TPA: hypothetical protein PKD53_20175, partial [Chloroflexaceae bacterium]|nr:hypothetical protein [Chloroflexaceae bacterium]
ECPAEPPPAEPPPAEPPPAEPPPVQPALRALNGARGGPGSTFLLGASGFAPGSAQPVIVAGRRVGTLAIGPDGSASLRIVFGGAATAGEHTVQVGSPAANATLAAAASLTLTVDPAAAPLPPGELAAQLFHGLPTVFLPSLALSD